MQMYKYSFRESIVILERELKRKLPAISMLHYRLKKIDDKILEEAILKISQEIIKKIKKFITFKNNSNSYSRCNRIFIFK